MRGLRQVVGSPSLGESGVAHRLPPVRLPGRRQAPSCLPPPWATAGFTGAPLVPWASSDSGQSLAYLFAKQLVAGVREDGTSNKVLWVMKGMGTLRVTAHPAAGAVPSIEIGGQMTNVN